MGTVVYTIDSIDVNNDTYGFILEEGRDGLFELDNNSEYIIMRRGLELFYCPAQSFFELDN